LNILAFTNNINITNKRAIESSFIHAGIFVHRHAGRRVYNGMSLVIWRSNYWHADTLLKLVFRSEGALDRAHTRKGIWVLSYNKA
jgi:hypothetical protein